MQPYEFNRTFPFSPPDVLCRLHQSGFGAMPGTVTEAARSFTVCVIRKAREVLEAVLRFLRLSSRWSGGGGGPGRRNQPVAGEDMQREGR